MIKNRKVLKEMIKNLIREKLGTTNFGPSDKIPYLRTNPDFDLKQTIDLKPVKQPRQYSNNLFGKIEKGINKFSKSDIGKTLDKGLRIYKDKAIDFELPKNKGTLTLGKIGVNDPLSPEERLDFKIRKDSGVLTGEIPKKADTFGVKWTIPIGKKS